MARNRLTAAELAEENARLSTENTILYRALLSVMYAAGQLEPAIYLNQGEAAERFDYGDCSCTLRLYRAKGADGGIVVMSEVRAGKYPTVSVYRLDDLQKRWRDDYSSHTLQLRIAIERLVNARDRICNGVIE